MGTAAASAEAAGPFPRTTGRTGAADAAAESAGAAVSSRDYGPDGSGWNKPEYTAARGRHERADALVRCTGLGARPHAKTRQGPGRVSP
jgi:hypothetical protein